jgi:hypothetical protein
MNLGIFGGCVCIEWTALDWAFTEEFAWDREVMGLGIE